jgi:hypothetical protein
MEMRTTGDLDAGIGARKMVWNLWTNLPIAMKNIWSTKLNSNCPKRKKMNLYGPSSFIIFFLNP